MAPPLRLKINFFLSAIFLCVSLWLPGFSAASEDRYVRVLVAQDDSSLSLRVNGFYEIVEPKTQATLLRGKNLKTTVTAYGKGISIGRASFNSAKILIKAPGSDGIIVNGRKFRGQVQLVRQDNAGLAAVNFIELEDYIRGILYHEVSHYWPIEALKAQAVVCRSFALYQAEANKNKDYDLTSDIYSQVYGGKTSERYRTDAAVEATKSQILVYKGKLFPAYYHATCGGHTEDASVLWDVDILPLKGVTCGFCQDSPHFKWHLVISVGELEEKLSRVGYEVKGLRQINIIKKSASGRVTELELVGNKTVKISAKDLRNSISPNLIRSTNFQVSLVNKDAVFEGFGWGHGVGLCQWGAYFMAKQGSTYKEILRYYYPGSNVEVI